MEKMERPLVLHVITRVDGGGSAVNTVLSVEGLAERGWPVTLVAGSFPAASAGRENFITLPSLTRNLHPIKDLHALVELTRLIRRLKPGLLHVHSSKAGFLGRLAGRLAGLPPARILYTPHGHVFHGYFGRFKTGLYLQLERWAARHTARIIALTDTERDEELAFGVGRPDQYCVIPSGVDLSRYTPRPETVSQELLDRFAIPPGRYIIGTLARLVRIKGVDLLIEAFRRIAPDFPDALLLIAGDGPEMEPLQQQVADAGLQEQVRFLGWLDDHRDFLQVLDLFVLASRNEGMGRAAVEAMASGLPVVGADTGGIKDLVQNGINGLRFAREDLSALAEALRLCLSDREKSRALGRAAPPLAAPYRLEAMIDGLDRLYRQLEDAQ